MAWRPRQGSARAMTFLQCHRNPSPQGLGGQRDQTHPGASSGGRDGSSQCRTLEWLGQGSGVMAADPLSPKHRADGPNATTMCIVRRGYLVDHHWQRWRIVPDASVKTSAHYGSGGHPRRKSATPCPWTIQLFIVETPPWSSLLVVLKSAREEACLRCDIARLPINGPSSFMTQPIVTCAPMC